MKVKIRRKLDVRFCDTVQVDSCELEFTSFSYILLQMTCVRILEIIPSVFERLYYFCYKPCGGSGILSSTCDFSWLHDIMDWGKSSLKVVIIYWQRAITSLLKFLKGTCKSAMASTIDIIEKIISSGELFIQKHSQAEKCCITILL